MSKKSSTFAPAFEKKQLSGAVVQLVRIPACHAVGREFESRPHRTKKHPRGCFFVLVINIREYTRNLFFGILRRMIITP